MNSLKQSSQTDVDTVDESLRAPVTAGVAESHTSQTIGTAATVRSEIDQGKRRENKIGGLVARVKALPEVRRERVEMLRPLIKSGHYQPSANDIAAAILNIDSTYGNRLALQSEPSAVGAGKLRPG